MGRLQSHSRTHPTRLPSRSSIRKEDDRAIEYDIITSRVSTEMSLPIEYHPLYKVDDVIEIEPMCCRCCPFSRFPNHAVEHSFLSDYIGNPENRPRNRFIIVGVFLFYHLFSVSDFSYPNTRELLTIRFLFSVPFAILAHIAFAHTYLDLTHRFRKMEIYFVLQELVLVISTCMHTSAKIQQDWAPTSVLMVLYIGFIATRMRAFILMIATLAAVPFYMGGFFIFRNHNFEWFISIYHVAIVVVAAGLGIFVTNSVEHYFRYAFRRQLELDREREELLKQSQRTNHLLLQLLPESVASLLMKEPTLSGMTMERRVVLACHILNFNDILQLDDAKHPYVALEILSRLYLYFDAEVECLQVERVKNVGIRYYCIAGLAESDAGFELRILELANRLRLSISHYHPALDSRLSQEARTLLEKCPNFSFQFTIGIAIGRVDGMLLDTSQLSFELVGEAFDEAEYYAEMSQINCVHVCQSIAEDFSKFYRFEEGTTRSPAGSPAFYLVALAENVAEHLLPDLDVTSKRDKRLLFGLQISDQDSKEILLERMRRAEAEANWSHLSYSSGGAEGKASLSISTAKDHMCLSGNEGQEKISTQEYSPCLDTVSSSRGVRSRILPIGPFLPTRVLVSQDVKHKIISSAINAPRGFSMLAMSSRSSAITTSTLQESSSVHAQISKERMLQDDVLDYDFHTPNAASLSRSGLASEVLHSERKSILKSFGAPDDFSHLREVKTERLGMSERRNNPFDLGPDHSVLSAVDRRSRILDDTDLSTAKASEFPNSATRFVSPPGVRLVQSAIERGRPSSPSGNLLMDTARCPFDENSDMGSLLRNPSSAKEIGKKEDDKPEPDNRRSASPDHTQQKMVRFNLNVDYKEIPPNSDEPAKDFDSSTFSRSELSSEVHGQVSVAGKLLSSKRFYSEEIQRMRHAEAEARERSYGMDDNLPTEIVPPRGNRDPILQTRVQELNFFGLRPSDTEKILIPDEHTFLVPLVEIFGAADPETSQFDPVLADYRSLVDIIWNWLKKHPDYMQELVDYVVQSTSSFPLQQQDLLARSPLLSSPSLQNSYDVDYTPTIRRSSIGATDPEIARIISDAAKADEIKENIKETHLLWMCLKEFNDEKDRFRIVGGQRNRFLENAPPAFCRQNPTGFRYYLEAARLSHYDSELSMTSSPKELIAPLIFNALATARLEMIHRDDTRLFEEVIMRNISSQDDSDNSSQDSHSRKFDDSITHESQCSSDRVDASTGTDIPNSVISDTTSHDEVNRDSSFESDEKQTRISAFIDESFRKALPAGEGSVEDVSPSDASGDSKDSKTSSKFIPFSNYSENERSVEFAAQLMEESNQLVEDAMREYFDLQDWALRFSDIVEPFYQNHIGQNSEFVVYTRNCCWAGFVVFGLISALLLFMDSVSWLSSNGILIIILDVLFFLSSIGISVHAHFVRKEELQPEKPNRVKIWWRVDRFFSVFSIILSILYPMSFAFSPASSDAAKSHFNMCFVAANAYMYTFLNIPLPVKLAVCLSLAFVSIVFFAILKELSAISFLYLIAMQGLALFISVHLEKPLRLAFQKRRIRMHQRRILREEQIKAEQLLLSMLPHKILDRIRHRDESNIRESLCIRTEASLLWLTLGGLFDAQEQDDEELQDEINIFMVELSCSQQNGDVEDAMSTNEMLTSLQNNLSSEEYNYLRQFSENVVRKRRLQSGIMRMKEMVEIIERIVESHGCEKIKSFGPHIIITCSVVELRKFHPLIMCHAALAIAQRIQDFNVCTLGSPVEFRMGMSCGTLVSGFMGNTLMYEVFGPMVSVAGQLAARAKPGQILVSSDIFEYAGSIYAFVGPQTIRLSSAVFFEKRNVKDVMDAENGEEYDDPTRPTPTTDTYDSRVLIQDKLIRAHRAKTRPMESTSTSGESQGLSIYSLFGRRPMISMSNEERREFYRSALEKYKSGGEPSDPHVFSSMLPENRRAPGVREEHMARIQRDFPDVQADHYSHPSFPLQTVGFNRFEDGYLQNDPKNEKRKNMLQDIEMRQREQRRQSVVSGDQTLSPLRNIDSASIGFPSVSLSYQHEFESQKNILRRLIKDDDDFDEPETK